MNEFDTFDEKISFPFVDNPTVTYLKDADLIKEEYKETTVALLYIHRLFFQRWSP